jgi:hypothetical protein
MDETTSPTSTAPSPTIATPPMKVDESQGLASGCFRRAFRLLVGVAWVRAGRRKERDDEDNTNPIDFRLIVSFVGKRSGSSLPLKIKTVESSLDIGFLT